MTSRATSGVATSGPKPAVVAAIDALVALACEATGFDDAAVSRESMRRLAEKHVARDGVSAVLGACTRRDASLVAECVRACIVNETYLFRQPEHFAFVEALVRGLSLQLGSSSAHVLRAWSAGCATGEEAWSLAATLRDAASTSGARVEVLATDLVAAHVDTARAGVCRPPRRPGNDLLTAPDAAAHGDLLLRTRVSDVVDEHGVVRAHLRGLVRFAAHDLREPPPANNVE